MKIYRSVLLRGPQTVCTTDTQRPRRLTSGLAPAELRGNYFFYSVAPLDFQDFIGPSGSSYDSEISHFSVPRFKDASSQRKDG